MNRNTLYAVGALVLAAVLTVLAVMAQRTLTSNLPERIKCRDEAEARALAGPSAIPVLGTGSMAPFIPPAPAGKDPLNTIVALVVLERSASFLDVSAGDLCIYYPAWHNGPVMHQAALKDSGGWIMSGLGNAKSEAAWRVTSDNFGGIVKTAYVW